MIVRIHNIALTPKLDVQEKGKVTEKEFAEVYTCTCTCTLCTCQ